MAELVNWPLQDVSPLRMAPVEEKYVRDEENVREASIYAESVKSSRTLVVGTTELVKDGKIRLIPMPSPDPKDPLNLPSWRKWTAIGAICFFGALSLSAEIIIGALLPIFLLEYAGLDPRTINDVNFQAQSQGINVNPLAVIPKGVPPPPLGMVAMLATVPLLANGIASFLLVPLSIAVGRRPVLLFAGACAWAGGLWAGLSSSLNQHLAARAIQGLGAGAMEALIPLIIQDVVFIHQRNKAMSAIVSSQSFIIVGLGIAAPYIAANYTWRWLYFITSGFGFLAWILLIALLPETRWNRTLEELSGQTTHTIPEGKDRPDPDYTRYTARTLVTEIGLFQYGFQWRAAARSLVDTLRSTIFPAVLWSVAANSIFIIAQQATAQLTSFALLAQGWQFQYTGLAVVPFVAAAALVYVVGGPLADRLSLRVTRHDGGRREAEHHLPNLVVPFASGIAGAFVFGAAGERGWHWSVLLVGAFLVVFAFLTTMTVINVYIVESYPVLAGPVLVNVSSLRLFVAFFLASQATVWVAQNGMLHTFAIYAEVMIVVAIGIPALYFGGKRARMWTAGKIHARGGDVKIVDDASSASVR